MKQDLVIALALVLVLSSGAAVAKRAGRHPGEQATRYPHLSCALLGLRFVSPEYAQCKARGGRAAQ
jgi:heme/copper-type cytochrome/quinol oxidase subunit 3